MVIGYSHIYILAMYLSAISSTLILWLQLLLYDFIFIVRQMNWALKFDH